MSASISPSKSASISASISASESPSPAPDEPRDIIDFPNTRPVDYDPDLVWVPEGWDGDEYTAPSWDSPDGNYVVAGGGRWGQNLIAVGKNAIYYESVV